MTDGVSFDTLSDSEKSPVACMTCSWTGFGYQLKAQACPMCDGRVRDRIGIRYLKSWDIKTPPPLPSSWSQPPTDLLKASELRLLAQYLIGAAVRLQQGTLSPEAQSLLREWTLANEHLRQLVGEGPTAHSATVTKRAIGMMLHQEPARKAAKQACWTQLKNNTELQRALEKKDWNDATDRLTDAILLGYWGGLVKGQD